MQDHHLDLFHSSPEFKSSATLVNEGCPILRQIYAWHRIVLDPPNNRLTIQYNRERSNTVECYTMSRINLWEYWTILSPRVSFETGLRATRKWLITQMSYNRNIGILSKARFFLKISKGPDSHILVV